MSVVATYKCPNCSAALAFGIGTQKWNCQYCGSTFTLDELKAQGAVAESKADAAPEFGEGVKAYSCPSCGARIVADENTAATFCVFCRNPALIADRMQGKYRPVRIIPFKIGKEAAKKAYRELCDRPLVPKPFRLEEHIESIRGLYAPFWLFTCSCRGKADFHCENYQRWSTADYNYKKTMVYRESREGEFTFASIPADGSKNLDDEMTRAIEPFNYEELVPFEMQYLAGHLAESYDVPEDEVLPIIFGRAKAGVEDELKKSVSGYALVTLEKSACDVYDSTAEYVMAPLWILVSKHKNKRYVFAMNAQTGKIVGKLPLSIGKVLAWFGSVVAVAGLIAYVVMSL